MIWGCFSWYSKLAEFINVLNDQVIPSINVFFPDGLGIFQDDNAKIHWALVVKEWSTRTQECQGAWWVIFTHELATSESWLYPIKSLWVVQEKTVSTLLSSIQNLGQKWMQLWMEINVVTLHKVVETMPLANALCNQSKRRSNEIEGVTFFWTGNVFGGKRGKYTRRITSWVLWNMEVGHWCFGNILLLVFQGQWHNDFNNVPDHFHKKSDCQG